MSISIPIGSIFSIAIIIACVHSKDVNSKTRSAGSSNTDDTDSSDKLVKPIAFEIVNKTASSRYVMASSPIQFYMRDGSEWKSLRFFTRGCTSMCRDVKKGSDCAIFCERQQPQVRVIAPSDRFTVNWKGYLYELNTNHCSRSECEDLVPALEGTYKAVVGVSRSYKCESESCSVAASGVIDFASLSDSDNYKEYSTEFSILHSKENVVIEINE